MQNNKTFLFLFLVGLACLAIAGLSLFLSLNPSLTRPYIQYEVGTITQLEGLLKKKSSQKNKFQKAEKNQKIYSKEVFDLKSNSVVAFKISEEEVLIEGPARFNITVLSPEKKEVFINFDSFEKIQPETGFQNITLTYQGWTIEPFFKKADLESSDRKEIDLPAIKTEDESSNPAQAKENILDELIASKRALLKRCYENYLRNNPMATGKLVVEFTLQNTGKVSSSKVKDSSFFKDESFKNCIQDVFKRIKTAPFEGKAILVTYPIEFE